VQVHGECLHHLADLLVVACLSKSPGAYPGMNRSSSRVRLTSELATQARIVELSRLGTGSQMELHACEGRRRQRAFKSIACH
jgi:hypothetical protein